MKRIGYLYEKICDMDNLRKAHKNARKGKGWYKEVREVDENEDEMLLALQTMLKNHTFKTSAYEVFTKREGAKERTIYKLPYYPDRIVQWAILQVIEPYIIRHFITDTYSAIPGRGIHKCAERIKHMIQTDAENCKYCLKIDIRHYYQSINHNILKQKFRKLFKDKELLWILDEIIDSIETANEEDLKILYPHGGFESTGIPIGNYLSQYCGNYYLSDFDHWLKEEQHEKYVFRYMDDIVIFGNSKEHLHVLKEKIVEYLTSLKLVLKANWQVFPTFVRGIDYVGYRFFRGYTLLRKGICKRMKQKMKHILTKEKSGIMMNLSEWCSIPSYRGWISHCSGFRFTEKYISPLNEYWQKYYRTKIRRKAA